MQSQRKYPKLYSFEFYPPKTEAGEGSLQKVREELAKLEPDFFSVTFGAGGSTRDKTYDTVLRSSKAVSVQRHTCPVSRRHGIASARS